MTENKHAPEVQSRIGWDRERMLAILNDVVEYYGADPEGRRATAYTYEFGWDRCAYLTADGRRCAVGRYMADPQATLKGTVTTLDLAIRGGVDSLLIPWARGLDRQFWSALQSLHDVRGYWGEKGLTEEGQECKEYIQQRIMEGAYDV